MVLITAENNVESPILVVPPVNTIKEEPGVLFVEFTVADFIDNETGRAYQRVEGGRFVSTPASGGEFVSQLRHLDEKKS